tara:strand:- start:1636 stop:1875 length:240 start_codon:yes stop_codon:yes gene_type:complete
MTWATPANTSVGDSVLVPLQNEFMQKEQICIEYEVVRRDSYKRKLALRCKVKPEDQIVGTGQPPLPEYLPFTGQEGYKK